MNLRWGLLGLAAFSAFAQQPTFVTVIGTVEDIAGARIEIRAGDQPFTVYADGKTEVLKDKTYHDFSVLGRGDEISARCIGAASGKLVARRISARILTFRGLIQSVGDGSFQVVRNRTVRFFPETTFSSTPKYLAVGEEVLVVGADMGDESIDALRVTIYNTDLPTLR